MMLWKSVVFDELVSLWGVFRSNKGIRPAKTSAISSRTSGERYSTDNHFGYPEGTAKTAVKTDMVVIKNDS